MIKLAHLSILIGIIYAINCTGCAHRPLALKEKIRGSYTVFGKTYQPLQSVQLGFSETGIASWYGPGFNGKKTSNGEIYDMHGMTAAHKTLPLNTVVRVTNLKNNREVVVRVNDRGPFIDGRTIDLSLAAATRLDLVSPGTTPVKISVLKPAGAPVEGGGTDSTTTLAYIKGSPNPFFRPREDKPRQVKAFAQAGITTRILSGLF